MPIHYSSLARGTRCRCLIVNAVYPPEPVVSAQMGRDLAAFLVGQGYRITVLCPAPSRPTGADYSAYQPLNGPLVRVEEGIEVVRLPSFTAPQSRLWPRMRESWGFGREVCRYLDQKASDADVVYANTWPLLSPALQARHCAKRKIPFVLHVQDLYPESLLIRLPGSFRHAFGWPLIYLDRWACRQAAGVVAISAGMREMLTASRGLDPAKVHLVPNWVDESRFEQPPNRSQACARYGIPAEPFTFLYLGNIGPVAGVELLIEAFGAVQPSQAQLVIAGDGSAKAGCVELAKRNRLSAVRFVSDPDAANVPLLQSLGHVCLLPMRRGAGLSSIPSKLMAYLLSAKPVLATVDAESDTARCIHEAQYGWVGEPENVALLAAKMAEVVALPPAVLAAMGQRGRAYGLKHFSKAEGVRRLAEVVLRAAKV